MHRTEPIKKTNQEHFRNMVVGILLYSVVLGLFNDYTHILHTGTYSITFSLAILIQVLTYLTVMAKDKIILWLQKKDKIKSNLSEVFVIWFIMFLSKFIFLGAISTIFRQDVYISGFFELIIINICLTFTQKAIEYID